jgi:DNA mismatch repair protein MutH
MRECRWQRIRQRQPLLSQVKMSTETWQHQLHDLYWYYLTFLIDRDSCQLLTSFTDIVAYMRTPPYDLTSPSSILEYSRGLSGKSLAEAVSLREVIENLSNKGDLGSMVESYYFKIKPPNTAHEPDFLEAGVELKTTGVLKDKSGQFKAKERLVLTMINYLLLPSETWDTCSLMRKCRSMLILFYEYHKDVAVYDRRFVYEPILWEFPGADLVIIHKDWELIWNKVKEGKAHELSEGDTYYLGACRKGPGGPKERPRKQPYSETPAKSRAFCLKQGYVNTIVTRQATSSALVHDPKDAREGIEALVKTKLERYVGKTVDEISGTLNFFRKGKNDKGFGKALAMRMLGATERTIPEFEKAGIEPKIITLQRNGIPKESLSFPAFDYMKIIDEDWEGSSFANKLERKFLFLVFQTGQDKKVRFCKAMFWNMPYEDREEARRVWEWTRQQIASGHAQELPKIIDSRVAHVRPHGKDHRDVLPTPQGDMLLRKSFWLNSSYIAEQIEEYGSGRQL